MSAFGGIADVNHYASERPLIAKSGHLLVRRVLLGALGPDRLAACLGDQSMRLQSLLKTREMIKMLNIKETSGRSSYALA